MPTPLNIADLQDQIRTALTLEPRSGKELRKRLGVSQPSLSRLIRGMSDEVVSWGKARATRYGLRRSVDGLPAVLPVHEAADNENAVRELYRLHLLEGDFIWAEAIADDVESLLCEDLPWFVEDMRPSGFLGALLAAHFDQFGPPDSRLWSTDHVLSFLFHVGSDELGNLVVGGPAMEFFRKSSPAQQRIPRGHARSLYPVWAAQQFGAGLMSSAGGEHPKFVARVSNPDLDLIVKFSPMRGHPAADRIADLLIAEHIALRVLDDRSIRAAKTEVVQEGGRVFLEVARFDRIGPHQRRGVVSFGTLDSEFGGSRLSWSASTAALLEAGVIEPEWHAQTVWLERFGTLIANTDMHHHNLSFLRRGTALLGLTPVYDMLPMAYTPRHGGELPDIAFAPDQAPADVADAARDFWTRVSEEQRVSEGFRGIAAANAAKLG